MPRFNDLLDSLGSLEGAYPETLLEDLMGAYDADVTELTGSHTAALDELTVANAELNTQLAALKQHNYDLLMAAPAATPEGAEPEGDPDEESADITIDDLFGDGDEDSAPDNDDEDNN